MKTSNRSTKVRTMTVLTAVMLVIFTSLSSFAQQQIKNYNYLCGNISSNDNARSIVNRLDGNRGYAIAGYSYHPTCGIGPFDWTWIQLRPDGSVNQSRYIGTVSDDKCNSLVQDQGDFGYILAGHMFAGGGQKATVVKLNSAGNFVSSSYINDTLKSMYSQVVIDPARYTGYTGYLEKPVGNKTRNKILVSKYTPGGTLNWAYRYDSWISATQQSPSIEEARSLCFQPAGACYGVAARTNYYSKSTTAWDPMIMKIDYATGAVIWKKVYRFNVTNPNYYPSSEPYKIIPMTDGGFVVVGTTNSILQNGSHILVFRVTSAGALMWSASYGNTAAFNYGYSIVLDGSNLTVAGMRRTGNAQDALMMKIPAAGGAPLWTRVWNPVSNTETGFDIIRSNVSTASTGYAVTGDVSLNSQDAFLWRTNSNGLLDSATCNSSVSLERIVNQIRLDSFLINTVSKNCKDFTPTVTSPNYVPNTICLGTFAVLPETEVETDNPVEEVKDYAIRQNYPNPFNPSTVINFQVPVDGEVSIRVYDISGKMVAELVGGFIQKGRHSVEFNASNLPSGAYYYRINANGFTDIKKMMLVK